LNYQRIFRRAAGFVQQEQIRDRCVVAAIGKPMGKIFAGMRKNSPTAAQNEPPSFAKA
jgi:hypothetical protein